MARGKAGAGARAKGIRNKQKRVATFAKFAKQGEKEQKKERKKRQKEAEELGEEAAPRKAQRTLDNAWKRPRTLIKVTTKKKEQLQATLRETVTQDRASPQLFRACFPNVVLVDAYEEKLAREKLRAEQAAMAKAAALKR